MKIVVLALGLLAGAAHAHYKCTAPGGAVTYQQAACPITQKQQVLFARPAPPDAVPEPVAAPIKSIDARSAPTATQRDRRTKETDQALTSIEAGFERLRELRAEIDETRKLASR